MELIHSYFSQFQYEKTVFPKVGKEYEFSTDGMIWEKTELGGFKEAGANWTFKYIRPIQPSRLEQLKAKHPNLTQDEQTELIDLLLKKE
jgi:predicted Rdx family selenoprotein